MFFQKGNQRPRLQIARAAGLAAADDLDRLILKVGSLSESMACCEAANTKLTI